MKTPSLKTISAICASAAIAGVACAALAQAPAPQGQGQGGQFGQGRQFGQGGQFGRGGRGGDPAQMSQRLHNQLQITPAQEQAFNAWIAAVRPGPPATPPTPPAQGATTLQKLDQAAAMETRREATFRAGVAATRTFYGQLSPAQRQTLDAMPIERLIGGGPGGRGGPDGGPGPRGGQGGRGARGGGQGGPNGFNPNAAAQ